MDKSPANKVMADSFIIGGVRAECVLILNEYMFVVDIIIKDLLQCTASYIKNICKVEE